MNALPPEERKALELVDIIEFKWLMANEGYRVHVERLQSDPHYIKECLALAVASPAGALRSSAQRLLSRLDLEDLPGEHSAAPPAN